MRDKGKAVESGRIPVCRILCGYAVLDSGEVLLQLLGELLARLIGWIIRRPLQLTPKQAQAWGERIVFGALMGAAVTVTVLYS